ncbi:microtubule-associated protein futsch isoform X2 [Drosophila kikkawai]|uniref:Microtubule-associated protein futsch isoform X2 n=1 Tax=Drosophila kikkawai TaxID=30033 RepID=A0ABM4GGN1_DROKI
MCNLNHLFRGAQRYHYSCCRRRMHCCSPGQNRTTEESIELCCPPTCPRITGSDKITAVEKSSTGKQLPRKSSSSSHKLEDPSKTNPLPKKRSCPTTSQRKNKNKSNDSSLSKGSPVQSNLSHKVSGDSSEKIKRLSAGSIRLKTKMSGIFGEKDSLMPGGSSACDCDLSMAVFSSKTSRKSKKMKPCNSKSEPQDADSKTVVKAKPKFKKIVPRRWPTKSPVCAIEGLKTQQQQQDGIWFECNLPVRVNIPFPISLASLFGLQSFPDNVSQCKALVPATNCGDPFCLTTRKALPAPISEPQPATAKKGLRRLRKRPSPCPCETSTQTGDDESDLLRCLWEIKDQLAAKSTECRCFAEKSTYVRTLKDQKKASEEVSPLKESEETLLSNNEVRKPTTKTKKTEKKKSQSVASTSVPSVLNNVPKVPSKSKKTEKKPKEIKPISSASSFLKEAQKPRIKTDKAEEKSRKPKATASTKKLTSKSSSKISKKVEIDSQKLEEKVEIEPQDQKPIIVTSTKKVTSKSSSKISQKVDHDSQKLEDKEGKGPQVQTPIIVTKPRESVDSIKVKEIEKNPKSLDPEPNVKNNSLEKLQMKEIEPKPEVEENNSKQIQEEWVDPVPSIACCCRRQTFPKEHEWIDPEPATAYCCRRQTFANEWNCPNECQGSEYQPCCMYRAYSSWTPSMYQPHQYPGHCYQQSWPTCQRNTCHRNHTPEAVCLYQRSPTATWPCRPCGQYVNMNEIDPVVKPSVAFCQHTQVYPEYTCAMSQGSQSQSSCMYQCRTSGHCCHRCGQNWQNQRPAIPVSSSTEYNKKALLKKSLNRNTSPKDSLSSQTPIACPCSPGVRRNRSICFRVCRSQSKISNETGHTNDSEAEQKCESCDTSSCRSKHQPFDRLSTGQEIIGIDESQSGSISREKKSVSGSILKNKIDQEYYFPLDNKSKRSKKSINSEEKAYKSSYQSFGVSKKETSDMICVKDLPSKEDGNIESKSSRGSGKTGSKVCSTGKLKGESQMKDNISCKQNKSKDGITEDQLIVSFTNRSFCQNSEELNRTSSEKQQKISQTSSNGIKTDEDLASQYSEKPQTKARSLRGSSRTDQEQDIDGAPGTSCKFDSRLIYSKLKQQSSKERQRLKRVSDSKNIIPSKGKATKPKNQSIPYLSNRPASGMSERSNTTICQKQAKNLEMSPMIPVLVNKMQRSYSAPGCLRTPVIYRQCFSPRNQIPDKLYTLTHDSDTVQDESCDSEMEQIPTRRIQEKYKPDKDMCKIPDYSLKASMMPTKQRCNARQEQQRANTDYRNRQLRRQNPPMELVPCPNRKTKNDCQPDEWREQLPVSSSSELQMESDKSYQVPKIRGQPRGPSSQEHLPYRQNTKCPHMGSSQNKGRLRKSSSNITSSPSEEECSTSDHTFSSPSSSKNLRTYGQRNQRDIKRQSTMRKQCSEVSLSESEDGCDSHYSKACKCQRKIYHGKLKSPSASSSSRNPASKYSLSVESSGKSQFSGKTSSGTSYSKQTKKNRSRCINRNSSQTSMSHQSEPITGNSDSSLAENSLLTSKEVSQESRSAASCKCSYRKSNQSGKTTDEEMDTVTLLQPRRLRSNESMKIWNTDVGPGNTVLLEIKTTCNKQNLLQTCGRPPCNFTREHYAGIPPVPGYHPQNESTFEETFLIEPSEHWSTVRSLGVTPAPSCQQQQLQIVDPHHQHAYNYYPQLVREAVEALPLGFYDHTIQQYNIIRMDSDFQVPSIGQEIIQAIDAVPRTPCQCGCVGCSYGNPVQQQIMRPVQDSTRHFIQPQNQMQTQPRNFCSRPNRQAEYQN